MTTTALRTASTAEEIATPRRQMGTISWKWMVTTDHNVIGNLYFISSMMFFLFGGILALAIRAELAFPGLDYLSYEAYNQFFTMHGAIMLLLFATPLFAGFANAIMPLQIGAPDVAFPRLNMISYWLYLFGGLIAVSGFLSPSGPPSFGWYAYVPLSNGVHSPGIGADLWIMGLYTAGLGTILGAVNFVTTIITMRAPGMTMFRMPIFTWNILVTSLPFFGIITEILPVFSRKPIFGYVGLVGATLLIAALSVAVWAHHMYVTGAVNLPFFAFTTFLIAVPTGVKFFNWIGTMWGGNIAMRTPMLWAIGFLVTFLLGGLPGVVLASPPLDFHLNDTYFVVAHFHYVGFGTVVFAAYGGMSSFFPR